MGRRFTELFGMLPQLVVDGVNNEDIVHLIVGDAGQSGPQDSNQFVQPDIGAGSKLNRFEETIVETGGNIDAAVGLTNQSVIDEMAWTGLLDEGPPNIFSSHMPGDINNIKISQATNAAMEITDAIGTSGPEEAITGLIAKAYDVSEADLIKAINNETAITESEDNAWGFELGVPSSIAQEVPSSTPSIQELIAQLEPQDIYSLDPPIEAPRLSEVSPRVTIPPDDIGKDPMFQHLGIMQPQDIPVYPPRPITPPLDIPDYSLDPPFTAPPPPGMQPIDIPDYSLDPPFTAPILSEVSPRVTTPPSPGKKEYDDAIWDELPQIMYPLEPGKQTERLRKFTNPKDAIDELLEEVQNHFNDEAYLGLTIKDWFKPHLDGILKSTIAQEHGWEATTADFVLDQWAKASPIIGTRRTGDIRYLFGGNYSLRDWYYRSVADSEKPPTVPETEGPPRRDKGWKPYLILEEWWAELPVDFQVLALDQAITEWEAAYPGEADGSGVAIKPADGSAGVVITPADGSGEDPLTRILAGADLMIEPPSLQPEDFLYLGHMESGGTSVILHYAPTDGYVYAELLGTDTEPSTWKLIEDSTLTEEDNQVTLEIGYEGSGLTFTNYTYKGAFTPTWYGGDQTAVSGLGDLTGLPPTSIGKTFAGMPLELWEAARTEQLGPKAHIPQYWETRMHGFVPAWGRYLMRNSHGEDFATYLSRPADQDFHQTTADWGLAVHASRALGTPTSYDDVGDNWEERVKINSLKGLLRSGKSEVMAMASAGLNINPDTYGGAAAYRQLSDMYDIFEQQEAGQAGDSGKFLAYIDDLMSGEDMTGGSTAKVWPTAGTV